MLDDYGCVNSKYRQRIQEFVYGWINSREGQKAITKSEKDSSKLIECIDNMGKIDIKDLRRPFDI